MHYPLRLTVWQKVTIWYKKVHRTLLKKVHRPLLLFRCTCSKAGTVNLLQAGTVNLHQAGTVNKKAIHLGFPV